MKEYGHLTADLQKEKENGIILEEYIYDDGIRNGRIHYEKKQWSTLMK